MADTAQSKPHITLTGKAVWRCADAYLERSGRSAKQAYDRWLAASLRDAMAQVYPVAPKKDTQADPQPAVKMPSKVRTSDTGNPVTPTAQLRQLGTALPKKGGEPITIKAAPRAAAVEQLTYSASMVRQMPGMTARREYSPPADLVRNQQRASAHQPPLASISTSDRN